MKKLQVAVTLACVLGAAWSCGGGAPVAPKSFADSKRGIQFQYPADWTVEELAPAKVLFVTGSAVTSLWSKYETDLNLILDSVTALK